MAENEINKVQVLIRRFLFEVDGIIHDPSACQAWLQSFCKTLQFQDLCKEPNQYALFLLDEARAFNIEQRRKSQMKQVRRALAEDGIKNPTQEQLDEKWLEMYGQENSPQDAPNGNAGVDMYDAGNGAASKSPTSCDTFTADGDIREDSQDRKSGTSANHYGDAATREGAEVVDSRESGATEPTTVSRNMRRVPQNEAPAHGFSGGRTAQGTMSRSPEAAAQSGKDYDQEARQGQALESRRTGADSLRSDCHSAPVRLPDFDEFTAFIDAQGLDYTDAREWWEMTMVDRDGHDRDGKPIRNWKITCRRFCEAKANKRKTAK